MTNTIPNSYKDKLATFLINDGAMLIAMVSAMFSFFAVETSSSLCTLLAVFFGLMSIHIAIKVAAFKS